jgi:redox-sensitive bicupin YhaK (pirin superfamily)
MITIRKAKDRGHADLGWLNTWYSFSFADYHDPEWMGFRDLRVINDDTVAGGGGFDLHPHRDMEIVTYVLSGALQHRDSLGNSAIMKAGDVQRISAGTGVRHSESNASPTEPVHLLQIWILPNRKGATPNYTEKSFATAANGQLHLIASGSSRDGSVSINQDAEVFVAKFGAGDRIDHSLKSGRHAWVQVAEGELILNGKVLQAGDGAALSDESLISMTADKTTQALVFEMN